jgi:hypothetical protein
VLDVVRDKPGKIGRARAGHLLPWGERRKIEELLNNIYWRGVARTSRMGANIGIRPSWLACAANRNLFAFCGACHLAPERAVLKDLSGPLCNLRPRPLAAVSVLNKARG